MILTFSSSLFRRANSQANSLQPFQPVMYPSALAPLMKSSSNPDLIDPVGFDLKGMSEKLSRTRNFWSNGLKSAASNLIKVPPADAIQINFQNFTNPDESHPSSINLYQQPFILNPKISSSATPPQSLHPQFFLTPPSTSSQMIFQNFPTSTFPPVQPQQPESLTFTDSLDQDSIADSEVTVIAAVQPMPADDFEKVQMSESNQSESAVVFDVRIENVDDDENVND